MAKWATELEFKVFGVPATALWNNSQDWEIALLNLEAAKSSISTAFRSAEYPMPLGEDAITMEMVQIQCIIAGYHFFRMRGWEATDPADAEFVKAYERALEWLDKVSSGKLEPLEKPEETPDPDDDNDPVVEASDAVVVSDARRGWGDTWP